MSTPHWTRRCGCAALLAWSALFGTISFELFGHFVGSVEDGDRYFDRVMTDLARLIGF